METLASHFHNWFAVIFFVMIYSVVLLFIPFYKRMDNDNKPKGVYIAFVTAFAFEMHGIPFSMSIISWIIGKNLPEGILWGHTLFNSIGYWGMYINIMCAVIALVLITNGWHSIYKKYWSKELGKGTLVKTGVYRYIRHPQYTGLLLLSFGMIAEWATLPTLIMFPLMIVLYVRLAKMEEKDMVGEFGSEYMEYRETTKMFVPFLI